MQKPGLSCQCCAAERSCTWRVALVGLMGLRELRTQVGAAGHAPPVVRHEEVRHRRLHATQGAGPCLQARACSCCACCDDQRRGSTWASSRQGELHGLYLQLEQQSQANRCPACLGDMGRRTLFCERFWMDLTTSWRLKPSLTTSCRMSSSSMAVLAMVSACITAR